MYIERKMMEQHDYIVLLKRLFRKEITSEERKILVEWIRKPGIRDEFYSICEQMWDGASGETDRKAEEEIWERLQSDLDRSEARLPEKRRWLSVAYRAAAAVLLPVCLGMAAWLGLNHADNKASQPPFVVAVDCGQKASLTLPDGTKVWLNSATRLSYGAEYNTSERRVCLDGEAYFEVAKDKEKRFVVCCDDLEIEALGTAFDVKGYSEDQSVTALLAEGSLRVADKANATLLKPGEKVVYHKSREAFTKSAVSDVREIDFWRNNMLVFNSAPLSEIAVTLERMYGVKVLFATEELKNVPFSGTIRNNSLHNVFYIISLTYPLTYDLRGDTVIIGNSLN